MSGMDCLPSLSSDSEVVLIDSTRKKKVKATPSNGLERAYRASRLSSDHKKESNQTMMDYEVIKRRQRCGIILASLWCCSTSLIVLLVIPTQLFGARTRPSRMYESLPTPTPTQTLQQPTRAPTASPTKHNDGIFRCNGLENLCDQPVNTVLFATLHNAATTTEDGVSWFPNHEFALEGALRAGYRGINFDLGKCDDTLTLVHGFCGIQSNRSPQQMMASIVAFLDDNPNEVLLVPTQINPDTGGPITLDEIDTLFRSVPGWSELLYHHPSLETPWPTLRTLIDQDTRLLFFHYNGPRCMENNNTTCSHTGLMDWFVYAQESDFGFVDVLEVDDKANACRATRGPATAAFYGVNVFTEIANTGNSCDILNDFAYLSNHLKQCATLTQQAVNLVLVDCWDRGDVLEVVRTHNLAL